MSVALHTLAMAARRAASREALDGLMKWARDAFAVLRTVIVDAVEAVLQLFTAMATALEDMFGPDWYRWRACPSCEGWYRTRGACRRCVAMP